EGKPKPVAQDGVAFLGAIPMDGEKARFERGRARGGKAVVGSVRGMVCGGAERRVLIHPGDFSCEEIVPDRFRQARGVAAVIDGFLAIADRYAKAGELFRVRHGEKGGAYVCIAIGGN